MKLMMWIDYLHCTPRGYGRVRDDFLRHRHKVAIIPLCYVLRFAWHVFYALTMPRRSWWERRTAEAYRRGYADGQDGRI